MSPALLRPPPAAESLASPGRLRTRPLPSAIVGEEKGGAAYPRNDDAAWLAPEMRAWTGHHELPRTSPATTNPPRLGRCADIISDCCNLVTLLCPTNPVSRGALRRPIQISNRDPAPDVREREVVSDECCPP